MTEKVKLGIEKYIKIMNDFRQTNVSQNLDFQKLFNGFYQVRRNAEWRRCFYSFMEDKKDTKIGIQDVLTYLYKNTPQNRIELSFSSKLLHTINPDFPIYDKKVADFLKLDNLFNNKTQQEKLNYQIHNYEKITDWYKRPQAQNLVLSFDSLFPEYANKIGNVKKIDFIIWGDLI